MLFLENSWLLMLAVNLRKHPPSSRQDISNSTQRPRAYDRAMARTHTHNREITLKRGGTHFERHFSNLRKNLRLNDGGSEENNRDWERRHRRRRPFYTSAASSTRARRLPYVINVPLGGADVDETRREIFKDLRHCLRNIKYQSFQKMSWCRKFPINKIFK